MKSQIAESNECPRLINKLGFIYARYGLLEPAEQQFLLAVDKDYLPAGINLGNVYYLKGEYDKSLSQFQKVYDRQSYNTKAILGLARNYYQLENYSQVNAYYQKLKVESPELAEKYAYLVSSEETGERASLFAAKEEVEWSEE